MKWKTKNTTLSEQFQNLIEKIIESGKIDTLNTYIHVYINYNYTPVAERRGQQKASLLVWR